MNSPTERLLPVKQLLVTGGSGFIGSHICARLQECGQAYTILDRFAPAGQLRPTAFVDGDVRDPDAVARALKNCDAVLHLAAAHHDSGISDATYYGVNEGSTKILIEQMKSRGIRRICFFSSAAVYGNGDSARDETFDPRPVGPYGASKLAAERLLEAAAAAGAIDALVVRPSVTFGPNNFANMYSLIRQIDRGAYLQVGKGDNVKSLSYVENLVDFMFWAWNRFDVGYEVFNWVESPDMTSREISLALADSLDRKLPRVQVPLSLALLLAMPFELASVLSGTQLPVSRMRVKKLAIEVTMFSSAKAREAGFKPRVSLREGIDRTVGWYREVGHASSAVRRIPPAQFSAMGGTP